jgi:hypothetical protein
VRVADTGGGSIVWDEVARLYGVGVSPFRVLSEELVGRAVLRQGDRIVDIGVGNGWGLIPAARTVALCRACGYQRATVEEVRYAVVLREPEHWWQIQWSHGARSLLRVVDPGTLRAMEAEALDRLESLKDERGSISFDLTMTLCTAQV